MKLYMKKRVKKIKSCRTINFDPCFFLQFKSIVSIGSSIFFCTFTMCTLKSSRKQLGGCQLAIIFTNLNKLAEAQRSYYLGRSNTQAYLFSKGLESVQSNFPSDWPIHTLTKLQIFILFKFYTEHVHRK